MAWLTMTRWGTGLPDRPAPDDAGQLVVAPLGLGADRRDLVDDHSGQLELGVVPAPDLVDGIGNCADPSKAERCRLDHDEGHVGSNQPVHGQVAERRGAIDQHGVVVAGHVAQGLAQAFRLAGLVILQRRGGRDHIDLQSPVRHQDVRAGPCPESANLPSSAAHRPDRGPAPRCSIPVGRDRRPARGGRRQRPRKPIRGSRWSCRPRLFGSRMLPYDPFGSSCHNWAHGDTRYLGGCRMLRSQPGRVASNVNSLGSGALP